METTNNEIEKFAIDLNLDQDTRQKAVALFNEFRRL